MSREHSGLTFEQWLPFVFDHPVADPAWHWDLEAPRWQGTPVEVVRFLTRLFENAGALLAPYSDTQLNQGLWYIASNGCSDYMFAFLDESVALEQRLLGLRAVVELYRQLFALRCTSHLSHLDEPGAGPLNSACYMWFDLVPLWIPPEDSGRQPLAQAMLATMAGILEIDSALPGSIACREGALHGLGHWHYNYAQQVEAIIAAFLQRNPSLRPELKQYAYSAKRGCVQ